MVEDVGFEPRFKLPKLACYHYTTSSILEIVQSLIYGAEGGTRTHDFQIISLVPYQLGHPNILYLYYNIFF